MSRTLNTAINGLVGFLIGYFVVARFKKKSNPLKMGVLVGLVLAIIAHLGYEKAGALEELEGAKSVEE